MDFQTLIVDDDPIYTMLMKKLLESNGFNPPPHAFDNGQLALDYLRENHQSDEAHVIFLDINMPVLNGWEFLDEISDFASRDKTFVLIVSSSINQSDMDRANSNKYVIRYLTKPILSSTIVELKNWIESRLEV